MKIKHVDNYNVCRFGALKSGDVFMCNTTFKVFNEKIYFMKINPIHGSDVNAVELKGGAVSVWSDNELCVKLDCELIVKG